METAINLEERIGNHIDNGNIMEEIESPSKRRFLKGLLGAGVIAVTPKLAFAQRRKKISDEARDRIWKNYPEMRDVINMINAGKGRNHLDYALFPNQEISNLRNLPIMTDKIPKDDMGTPQYWLLVRIDNPGTRSYNLLFDGRHDHLGVPPLSPHTGVWYFARSLKSRSSTNESDLLKALYIGATGSPQGAEPIINGTFMNVSGVREKVREWREEYDFAPHSDEGNHLLAYNLNILREAIFPNTEHFKGRELVELSLLALEDFYDEVYSPEKSNIYGGRIVGDLTKKDKLPGYFMIDEAGAESPLPVLRFHSR